MAIKPLHGIRILDLTNVLAGPFACHQLAHMGADVELNKSDMGVSFLAQNPGKRSITLNLTSPKGKEVFRRLVRTAYVVMENFRPGVMDRLGFSHAELMKENRRLVYCAISGFGQDGPLRDLPAYDQIIQGMSGIMSVSGAPENAPYRVGYPVADTIGGITAAFAVAAALADRNRSEGVFIDVSMFEAAMATMGWAVSNHLIAGRAPMPLGNDNVTASPAGTFKTGDGLINIAANKQEHFEAVCRVLGHPNWMQDARFVDGHQRLKHRDDLRALMEQAIAARITEQWWRAFNEAGVPAGPVYTVPQALSHPQIDSRGMIATFESAPGECRDIRVVRTGFKLNARRRRSTRRHRGSVSTAMNSSTNLAIQPVRSMR